MRVIVLGRFINLELLEGVARRGRCRLQRLGHRELGRVVEFAATESEDLQSIVVVGIVRRRHDDADAPALLGDDRDPGGREITEVDAVRTTVTKSGEHGSREEWRALSRVVADEDVGGKGRGAGVSQPVGHVVGDFVGGSPTNTIRAELHGHDTYRFEYCGALRAFLRPYFLVSFLRESRVRRPAFFRAGRTD